MGHLRCPPLVLALAAMTGDAVADQIDVDVNGNSSAFASIPAVIERTPGGAVRYAMRIAVPPGTAGSSPPSAMMASSRPSRSIPTACMASRTSSTAS